MVFEGRDVGRVAAAEKEKILLGKVNHQQVEILRCHAPLIHLLGARVKDVEVVGDRVLCPPRSRLAIRSLGLRQPIMLAAVVPQRHDSSILNRARHVAQQLEEVATVHLDILEHLVGFEKRWWRCAIACRFVNLVDL
jgi:hypothetical protein